MIYLSQLWAPQNYLKPSYIFYAYLKSGDKPDFGEPNAYQRMLPSCALP